MRNKNIVEMERLSLFCHICGLFTIFLGLLVVFIDYLNEDFQHIQVGIFIFATGYSFVKISTKVSNILFEEKWLESEQPKKEDKQDLTRNQNI